MDSDQTTERSNMYGTIAGNLAGIAYFLYFQFIGLLSVFLIYRRERTLPKLIIGSTAGSLLATWLPVLFSFFFDFTLLSHMLALLAVLPVPVIAFLRFRRRHRDFTQNNGSDRGHDAGHHLPSIPDDLRQHLPFFVILLLFLILWTALLHSHTILPGEDGAIYTGQCTYGDMNMHLGFITSVAVQKTFPPDYSIMPGVRLSYPFLSDSISSGLYVMGASLGLSYMLPMIFAMAQIFSTVYLFAHTFFHDVKKNQAVRGALLTCFLFFCNGGFGFVYFLDWARERNYVFSDIFTGYYTTPTNLVNQNIRWVNVIADMFLPQRATLFGYACLFPALWLLYRAAFQKRRDYFPLAGLFAAALPMIHTHSFLSAGVISAVWLLLWLYNKVRCTTSPAREKNTILQHPGAYILAAFVVIMCLLQWKNNKVPLTSQSLMLIGISLFAGAVTAGICLLTAYIRKNGLKLLLRGWGIYLLIVLIFALPQLLFWTFGQVAEGGFVRGHFNWGNLGDFYPWFYLKNLGIPLLLILGGICACGRRKAPIFLPVLFLWWLGELIVFTPNTYDNNKLLYVAYFFLCIGAADYGLELYKKLKDLPGRRLFAAAFFLFASLSGILTLGREAISRYQLYGTAQTALAEYVEENTPIDAVFLTDTRHNNEIASLTGRNIVCGADAFLYYHGLDTTERKRDLQMMYEAPLAHMDLFEKYHVDYVVISAFERRSYNVDEAAFSESFAEVFSYGNVRLFRIR